MSFKSDLFSDSGSAEPTVPTRTWKHGWLPVASAVAGCLYFVIHSLRIILGPEQRVMEWLYDDSFYYMITAYHFSAQHLSSFDGTTVTSGYHPLWMWLCSLTYGMRGQLDLDYVRSCMALSLLIASGVLFAGLYQAVAKRSSGILWALALGTTSYSALNNGLSAMEWPLVILSWFLLHQVMISPAAEEKSSQRGLLLAALIVGIAGSLSRTDFGLIPASYLAGGVLIAVRDRRWSFLLRAAAGTLGAVAGLGLVLLYDRQMTGTWVQMSTQVKHLFASLTSPFNPVPAVWQFLRVLFYLPALDRLPISRAELFKIGAGVLAFAVILLSSGVVLRRRLILAHAGRMWREWPSTKLAVLAAAFVGVTGYTLVYGLNSQATYGWYSATVTGFILLIAAQWFRTLEGRVAAAVVLPILAWNMVAAEYFGGTSKTQTQEIVVAKRMHAEHPQARMGGGDVGKPSFYNNGTMINLDGLMNNEVFPYLAAGRIHCYLLHRHIEYSSGIGTISIPLTDAIRRRQNQPPLPWLQYFAPVDGRFDAYLVTNFDAIRRSGECAAEEDNDSLVQR